MLLLPITIRPVEHTDAPALHQNCFSMMQFTDVEQDILEHIRVFQAHAGVQLVAVLDTAPIASALLLRNTHHLARHRGTLYSLIVHPAHHGRGVARALVEALCQYAQDMGMTLLETSCRGGEPAAYIYPKFGFIQYGRLPRAIIETWGERHVYDEVFFYKETGPVRL